MNGKYVLETNGLLANVNYAYWWNKQDTSFQLNVTVDKDTRSSSNNNVTVVAAHWDKQ